MSELQEKIMRMIQSCFYLVDEDLESLIRLHPEDVIISVPEPMIEILMGGPMPISSETAFMGCTLQPGYENAVVIYYKHWLKFPNRAYMVKRIPLAADKRDPDEFIDRVIEALKEQVPGIGDE